MIPGDNLRQYVEHCFNGICLPINLAVLLKFNTLKLLIGNFVAPILKFVDGSVTGPQWT